MRSFTNSESYTYNYMDENYYTIKANKPLKPGKHLVKAVYERVEGNAGRLTLFIDDAKVGQGAVGKVVFGRFSISETFDIGADNGGSVDRHAYTSPFKFNGQLEKVDFQLQPIDAATQKMAEEAVRGEMEVE